MYVAIERDGEFIGYVPLEGAEAYCVSNSWLEMLYRLPDGRWFHLYEGPPEPAPPTPCGRLLPEAEALRHLLERAEIDYLPRLAGRDWFQRYQIPPDPAALGPAHPPPPRVEALAKAYLHEDTGMSNAQLAQKLGVHRSTVGRWPWLARFRESLKSGRERLPRGHRRQGGQVEAWMEYVDPDVLDKYERGELR
jgi:hypothetical protein